MLSALGVDDAGMTTAFALIDRKEKFPPDVFAEQAAELGLDAADIARLDDMVGTRISAEHSPSTIATTHGIPVESVSDLEALSAELNRRGITAIL